MTLLLCDDCGNMLDHEQAATCVDCGAVLDEDCALTHRCTNQEGSSKMMRCCQRCGRSITESQTVWYRDWTGKVPLCRACYSLTPEAREREAAKNEASRG